MNAFFRLVASFLQSPSLQAAALAEANCWDELISLFAFPHVATSATMLAFQATPVAVTAPVTQNGKMAGMSRSGCGQR